VYPFYCDRAHGPGYATSTLWTSGEWCRHCLAGAAQAFDPRIPKITWTHTLASALDNHPALDNFEASAPLKVCHLLSDKHSFIAVGVYLAFCPERGFGPADRATLRTARFTLAHLGSRVLRVETAVVAALAITRAA